jgi:hypothetical protein
VPESKSQRRIDDNVEARRAAKELAAGTKEYVKSGARKSIDHKEGNRCADPGDCEDKRHGDFRGTAHSPVPGEQYKQNRGSKIHGD